VAAAFRLPDATIRTIHDGVDTRAFRPLEIAKRPNELLFVGNSDDQNKGARYLIEAVKLLDDRGIDFHLTFKDRVNAQMVPRMLREMGLAHRVTFLGRQSLEELVRLYNEAQVLVSPSLYEGFGLPAAEAMACGTPVVATTAGAFPETIVDGETGVLVPPADARALADAIAALLADPQRRAAMGAAGSRRIEQHFSWGVCAQRTAELYEEVLADRRGGTRASR
jgi:glycosyltransferase involved in cell wall biosynthesis